MSMLRDVNKVFLGIENNVFIYPNILKVPHLIKKRPKNIFTNNMTQDQLFVHQAKVKTSIYEGS